MNMGLYRIIIKFEQEIPSFQTISLQYERQTGLRIQLVAVVNFATGDFAQIMDSPSKLLPLLQADLEAVDAIDARYKAKRSQLLLAQNYEQAAFARDQNKKGKEGLTYIKNITIEIVNGGFDPIDISMEGREIVVEFEYESYAAVSFIKTLVDLGGNYPPGGALPKSWHKMKRWNEYKWYNRPRR